MKTVPRDPVVVILGHVDHGKTTLLDTIRKTNITEKEAGGITQSIGAFQVTIPDKHGASGHITFIDTPGHEAFTKLRARGAEVADCAVLIVDAVDSVMPQTVESLYHIKNAQIPFVVAINKTDLPGANVDKVRQDLMREGVLFDNAGGDTPQVAISAKKGTGVDTLLEAIALISSLKNLTYSPDSSPCAYIIESKKDKAGVVVSAIITDGTMKVGDVVYASGHKAKIRALLDDRGKQLTEVLPSTPFQLLGFSDLPEVGVAITGQQIDASNMATSDQNQKTQQALSAADFFKPVEAKRLKVIVKADSKGSLEAISGSLAKNSSIEIVLMGIGEISKSDIFLAKTTSSIVIGFSTGSPKDVAELARQEKVVIKTYSIIYQLLEELEEVSALLQEKEMADQQVKGEAKILATFVIEKEKIAGIKIIKGKLSLNDKIELVRNERVVGKTKIVSLKTRAQTVNELKKGSEGGVLFYPLLDFNIGDVIKSYSI